MIECQAKIQEEEGRSCTISDTLRKTALSSFIKTTVMSPAKLIVKYLTICQQYPCCETTQNWDVLLFLFRSWTG